MPSLVMSLPLVGDNPWLFFGHGADRGGEGLLIPIRRQARRRWLKARRSLRSRLDPLLLGLQRQLMGDQSLLVGRLDTGRLLHRATSRWCQSRGCRRVARRPMMQGAAGRAQWSSGCQTHRRLQGAGNRRSPWWSP